MGVPKPPLLIPSHDGNYANVLFFAGVAVLLTLGLTFMACKYYNDYEMSLRNRVGSFGRRIRPKKFRTSTKNGNTVVFTQKLWLGKTKPTTLLDRSKLLLNDDQDEICDENSSLCSEKVGDVKNDPTTSSSVDRYDDIEVTSPEIFV